MGATAPRTLQDRAAGIERQLRSLVRDPAEWDAEHLHLLTRLHDRVDEAQTLAVYACRLNGWTDTQIGQVLGVTQQAVSKRWPPALVGLAAASLRHPGTQPKGT